MKLSTLSGFTAVLFIGLLTYGCSGGSSSSDGGSLNSSSRNTSLNGNWVGTWKNDGLGPGSQNQGIKNEGFIRAKLKQDARGNVSGTATWTGFSCFLNTTVTGIVSGSGVSLTFVGDDNVADITTAGREKVIRVTFIGQRTSDNNHMSGNWDNDVGCLGKGELSLTRG